MLIVITLLAFIVILLVGLAAYTRIETSVAGNTQRQAQARENALTALTIALGQLQKYAGHDQRVTATAEAFENVNGTSRYTGVWHSDSTINETPAVPLTWLVSGNELTDAEGVAQPLAVTPAEPGAAASLVELVGRGTTGSTSVNANYIRAPLQPITVKGLPSAPPSVAVTIGRYAWWVGDQGAKAPVALPDTTDSIEYAPYDTADLRSRIRQQMAIGAGAADGSGNPVFDPREGSNPTLVAGEKIATFNQLAFLRWTSITSAATKLSTLRSNFHTWSPNNLNVLADSKRGGLRDDLSLVPQRLGSAFSAWARYERPLAVAMETPVQPEPVVGTDPPGPMPAYGSDPLRRRFFITPNVAGGGVEGGIHPVLAFFGLSFSIRDGAAPNYEVSARCVVGLWNPHSSSLVPPAGDNNRLELHVSELPNVRVQDSEGGDATISLQSIMGSPTLRFTLAWPDEPGREDEASWLPGRVYYWTAESNTDEPAGGNVMVFNERNSTGVGGPGLVRPAGIAHGVSLTNGKVYRQCSVSNADNTALRVSLVRARDQVTLATFDSPKFRDFATAPELETDHKFVDFAFVFRLPDPAEIPEGETATWLSAAERDPRRSALPGAAFVTGENGPHPELYGGVDKTGLGTAYPSRLIDRSTTSHDYNEDVPVFELPRGPFLSMGALQHLLIPSARPFAIGNSWGTAVEVNGVPANALFDRFFFSGLVADVVPATTAAGDLILPNALLKPLRKPDATKVTITDIRNMANPPDTTTDDGTVIPGGPGSAASSKFFLQGGAFNLNSASAAAWAAVLRSSRFPAPQSFSYHDVSVETGTAADDARATVQSSSAQFFRFSHSAQETYKAEWPPAGTPEDVTPPRTDLYRRGMRTLDGAEVAALAGKIAEFVARKHAASGPFRSLEEFLSPLELFGVPGTPANPEDPPTIGPPRSLLEAAIEDAKINDSITEFSSQWLTQADIMTALAPVLFPRSDTFVIRTYGEAINPAKLNANGSVPATAVEGRAWCEAIVQRVPEYMDPHRTAENPDDPAAPLTYGDRPETAPAALTSLINQTYGRRFKVVSFRWLTRSDI